MKRYKIVRIDEADYGCEGRPDGEEAMSRVAGREEGLREKRHTLRLRSRGPRSQPDLPA